MASACTPCVAGTYSTSTGDGRVSVRLPLLEKLERGEGMPSGSGRLIRETSVRLMCTVRQMNRKA